MHEDGKLGNQFDSDESRFEKILGHRNEANGSYSYFTKILGKPYKQSEWISENELSSENKGSLLLKKYNKLTEGQKTTPPFYDPIFDVPDRIIAEKDGKYLVKWMHLLYDGSTWENEIDKNAIELFKHRSNLVFPSKICTPNDNDFQFSYVKSYQVNQVELDDQQLEIFNFMVNNWVARNNVEFYEDIDINMIYPTIAMINYIHHNYSECGPFLIIVPYRSLLQWYDLLRTNQNMVTLCYSGPKEARKIIHNYDFDDPNDKNKLKFHVLLTSPDILISEMEIISSIHWNLSITIENELPEAILTKLQSFIQNLIARQKISFLKNSNSHQHIYIDNKQLADLFQSDKIKEQLDQSIIDSIQISQENEIEHNVIEFKRINCPLNELQRQTLRRLLCQHKDEILANQFIVSSQYIQRLCVHPSLINFSVHFDTDICSINHSTKMKVMDHIIHESLKNGERILITTELPTFVVYLRDFCIEKKYLNPKDQSGSKISIISPSISGYPSAFSESTIFIIHDGPLSIWKNILQNVKNSKIKVVYKLETYDCKEDEFCEHTNSLDPELLCKRAALCSLSKPNFPSIKELLDNPITENQNPCISSFLERGFPIDGFWKTYFSINEINKANSTEIREILDENHEWTKNERIHLFQSALNFGWNRHESIRNFSGLNVKDSFIDNFLHYILKFMISMVSGKNSFPLIRDILNSFEFSKKDDTSKFFQGTVFAEESFLIHLKQNHNNFLKRIELLHFIKTAVESNDFDSRQIPINSPPLSDWWSWEYDRALLTGVWKYGYRNFDYFVCDPDDKIREIALPHNNEIIPYSKLNERTMCLAESLKFNYLNIDKLDPKLITFADDKWSYEEKDKLINHLMKFGLETDENFDFDYKYVKDATSLDNKTVEEVASFINELRQRIKAPCDSNGGIGLNVAFLLDQRIEAMHYLRQLFYGHSEAEMMNIFNNSSNWRFAPPNWTKEMEYTFFKNLLKSGFGSQNEILKLPQFSEITENTTAISQDFFTIKRIRKLNEESKKKNTNIPSKSNTNNSHSQHKAERSKSSTESNFAHTNKHTHKIPSKHGSSKNNNLNDNDQSNEKPPLSALDIFYPITITPNSFIHEIGTIVYDRSNFHTERYIYPAGFKSSRLSASVDNPDERVRWYSQIVDTGEDSPVCRVWMEGAPEHVYEGLTPTAPWSQVLKAVANSKRSKGKNASISGPEAFLLASPITTYLIQSLPNANKCTKYVFRNMKDHPLLKKFQDRMEEEDRNDQDYDFANEDEPTINDDSDSDNTSTSEFDEKEFEQEETVTTPKKKRGQKNV